MIIKFAGWYSPALCQLHPDKYFVFGDNLRRFGKGGQAIIRSEPNARGIATKRKPSKTEESFFKNDSEDDLNAVLDDLADIWKLLDQGEHVVVPVTKEGNVSLGLERAELQTRAPVIYETIAMHIKEMCDAHGVREVGDADGL